MCQRAWRQALDPGHEVWEFGERVHPTLEVAGDDVEADPAETHRRLPFASGIGHDRDRALAVEDRAAPCCVAAVKADVEASC